MSEFRFHEAFSCFGEKSMPHGIWVEENSVYTHHHVRTENGVFYITCRGNHYFCKTPALYTFMAEFLLGFHNTEHGAGYRLVLGYDHELRTGYILDFWLDNGQLSVTFAYTDKQIVQPIQNVSGVYTGSADRIPLKTATDGTILTVNVGTLSWEFSLPPEYKAGLIGLTFTGHIGELAVYDIQLESRDSLSCEILCPAKTFTLSLRNGGTMPYTLQYELVQYGEVPYLRYVLDGGVQYREQYAEYPRITGQYWSEFDQIFHPYLILYQADTGTPLEKIPLYNGDFTVMDPAMHWRVLRSYFNVLQLPLSGMVALDTVPSLQNLQIVFGYANRISDGFHMQAEENMEFIHDFLTGTPIYEGKTPGTEHIQVRSKASVMAERIPGDVYAYDIVLRHLKNNHFFAESEEPSFAVCVVTQRNKAFISVSAELQDVYGDRMDDMLKTADEEETIFTYPPLAVGVYRVCFDVWYGDTVILTREIVFEVCGSVSVL